MAETPLSPESAAGETAFAEAPFHTSGDGPFPASDGDAGSAADPGATDGADNAETGSDGESPPAATAISTEDSVAVSAADPAAAETAAMAAETMTGEAMTAEDMTAEAMAGAAPWIATAEFGSDGSIAEPLSPSFEPFAAPSPEPAPPASGLEPQPAAAAPAGIATTIAVPPLETAARAEGDGGEWELLVAKLNAWFNSGELAHQWQKIQGPLKGVAILVGVILALRLYATVVGTLDAIPLLSGLLELTGLIVVVRFSLTKMVKTSEREQVLATWNRRWQAFIGQD